jgi:NAD(P)-dependent dehydrogenase (short-subunit alcohol dehydrogenase family)
MDARAQGLRRHRLVVGHRRGDGAPLREERLERRRQLFARGPTGGRVADECRVAGAEALVVKADVALDADCRRLAAEVDARSAGPTCW